MPHYSIPSCAGVAFMNFMIVSTFQQMCSSLGCVFVTHCFQVQIVDHLSVEFGSSPCQGSFQGYFQTECYSSCSPLGLGSPQLGCCNCCSNLLTFLCRRRLPYLQLLGCVCSAYILGPCSVAVVRDSPYWRGCWIRYCSWSSG